MGACAPERDILYIYIDIAYRYWYWGGGGVVLSSKLLTHCTPLHHCSHTHTHSLVCVCCGDALDFSYF